MNKPKECPKCKSDKVMRIIYGLVPPENFHLIKNNEVLGGCILDDTLWLCNQCRWRWGKDKNVGHYEEEVE